MRELILAAWIFLALAVVSVCAVLNNASEEYGVLP